MSRRRNYELLSLAESFRELRNDYDAAKQTRFKRRRTGIVSSGSGADYHYRTEHAYFGAMETARDLFRNHCLIAQASGHQELADALGSLHDRLVRFMVISRMGETLEPRHARIIEVLRSRDVEAACQAMLSEVNETRVAIMERVIEQEGPFWRLGSRSAA